MQRGKKTIPFVFRISEVDSSLNLYVSRLSCIWHNKMEKIYKLELQSGRNVVEHNVIIETANKIINNQAKSVMLDFFYKL